MPLVEIVEQSPESRILGPGYTDGQVLVVKHEYQLSYPDDSRLITPAIEFPFGEELQRVLPSGARLHKLALRDSEEALLIAVADKVGRVHVLRYGKQEHFLSGEIELFEERLQLSSNFANLQAIYLGGRQDSTAVTRAASQGLSESRP